MLFAFVAAFAWGAASVMSKKGVEELDAGGVFFWQICSAVIPVSYTHLDVYKRQQ